MRLLLPASLLVLLTGCATNTGPAGFAKSMTKTYDLQEYKAADLNNKNIYEETAFIYTLLKNTQEIRIHQFNGQTNNRTFLRSVKTDGGYQELVFNVAVDKDGKEISGQSVAVTDCENKGSFNYKHPFEEPLGHFAEDIFPWMLLGNCREDSTTQEQRIHAYVEDIKIAFDTLQKNHTVYRLPETFNFFAEGQSETIALFKKALT